VPLQVVQLFAQEQVPALPAAVQHLIVRLSDFGISACRNRALEQ
jgi:hypothetical protein